VKEHKIKTAIRIEHRNDRAQVKRVLAGSGQAPPMLERLEGAQASIDELMYETGVAVVEQLLVLSAQELAGAKQRGRNVGHVPDDLGLRAEFDLPAHHTDIAPDLAVDRSSPAAE
jgi:hypothetical protein